MYSTLVLAALAGMIVDSFLGATLEEVKPTA